MSLLSQASLTRRTVSARPADGTGLGTPATRRRAEDANCLQAAGVRPRTSAISAKGW
jgi:hypothetical protein